MFKNRPVRYVESGKFVAITVTSRTPELLYHKAMDGAKELLTSIFEMDNPQIKEIHLDYVNRRLFGLRYVALAKVYYEPS